MVDELPPGINPVGHRAVVVLVLLDASHVLIGGQVRDRAGRWQIRAVRRVDAIGKIGCRDAQNSVLAAPRVGFAILLPTPSIGSTPCDPTTPVSSAGETKGETDIIWRVSSGSQQSLQRPAARDSERLAPA